MAACTAHKKSRSLSLRIDTSHAQSTEPRTPSRSERLLRDIAIRDMVAQSPRQYKREIHRDSSRSPFEAKDNTAGSYLFCTSLTPSVALPEVNSRASSRAGRDGSRARIRRSGSESTTTLCIKDSIDVRARLERMLLEDCCTFEERPQYSQSRPSTPRVPHFAIGRPLTPDVLTTTFSRRGTFPSSAERPSRITTPTPEHYQPLQQHSLPLPVKQPLAAPAPRRYTTNPDHRPTSPLAHATTFSSAHDCVYASPPGSTPPSTGSSQSTPASSAVQTPHSSTSSLDEDVDSDSPRRRHNARRGLYDSPRRRPGFDAEEATRRLASVDGYVSFQSIEGLGAPPECGTDNEEDEGSKRVVQAQPWRWLW